MLLEKEAKLISALRTMGLPLHLYFLSYWIVYGAMYVLGGAIMTAAYALCGFFPNSDLFLLFLTTVFNVPATLAFMSCVVGKCSKQAGQTLAFFGSWVFIGLFILFERTGVPSAAWYPLCIFPMFAGPAGGYRFYELEATGEGLTWAELTSSGSGPRCWTAATSLCDTPCASRPATVATQTHKAASRLAASSSASTAPAPPSSPSLSTAGKGPSLLVTWAFQLASAVCWLWWATRLLSAGPAWVKQMPERAAQPEGPAVEESGPPPEGASEAVRLVRLSRAFAAKPKPVVALDALSLSLYEGQITALLGQNGAGKTTTIGILTGLFPQSSGEATVYGHSVTRRAPPLPRTASPHTTAAFTRADAAARSAADALPPQVRGRGMDAIRRLSGVCPQHDLTFAALSALENLQLAGAVKGLSPAQLADGRLEAMLESVGLEPSRHAVRTDNLSGGQKRKLSLACALIGDPKLVLLDEPTAGMDPASRRTVWGAMAAAKAGRTIVLTTHFLDEADALGDRIAVMHKGRLRAVGTSLSLKRRYGRAQHLTVARPPGGPPTSAQLLALVQRHVPEASVEQEQPEEVAVALPTDAAAAFAPLFEELDTALPAAGARSYGLSVPSLQEVFLRIADNADAEDAAAEEARAGVEPVQVAHSRRPWGSAWPRLSAAKPPRQSAVAPAPPAGAAAAGPSAAASALASAYVASDVEGGSRYRGASGWAQVRLLSILYYQSLTSDWALPLMMAVTTAFTLAAFIIPAYLGYGNLDTVANRTDASLLPSVALSSPDAFESAAADLANAGAVAFPYAPETGTLQAGLGSAAFEAAFGYSATPLQDAAGIGVAIRSAATGAFGAASLGADGAGSPPLPATSRLFHNRSHEAALPVTLHAISRALFASVGGNGTLSGAAALLPYVGETKPDLPFPYGSIISPNVLSFVFLFLALGAVSELVKQRLITKSNHQMMVMGLSPALRWVGELSVWLLLIWYHCALVLVVMLAMGSAAPTSAAVPVFFLEVLLAGPAAVCFFALFNFLFWCKIETANGADDLVGNVVCQVLQIFVMYPSVILSIPSVRESEVAFWVLTLFSLLTPVGSITACLNALYLVAQKAQLEALLDPAKPDTPAVGDFFSFVVEIDYCDGGTLCDLDPTLNPGPLLCIAITGVSLPLWFWLLWRIDVKRFYRPVRGNVPTPPAPAGEDEDVAAERARAEAMAGGGPDGVGPPLLLQNLRKTFASPRVKGVRQPRKVAVDNLSLAVDGGCFSLLGPNGAGKTTTLSMLTGDLRPGGGDAWVCGYSVRTQLLDIFRLCGYCPQFGGLFHSDTGGLTLYQHLEAYGRLKGVPEPELRAHCDRVVAEFGLQDHVRKAVRKLSGGTRRKLIAAIALSSDPRASSFGEAGGGDSFSFLIRLESLCLGASASSTSRRRASTSARASSSGSGSAPRASAAARSSSLRTTWRRRTRSHSGSASWRAAGCR